MTVCVTAAVAAFSTGLTTREPARVATLTAGATTLMVPVTAPEAELRNGGTILARAAATTLLAGAPIFETERVAGAITLVVAVLNGAMTLAAELPTGATAPVNRPATEVTRLDTEAVTGLPVCGAPVTAGRRVSGVVTDDTEPSTDVPGAAVVVATA